MNNIICKNCGRQSLFDYYDFCSVYCCSDYASKHDLLLEDVQYDFKSLKIEDLEYNKEKLEYEVSDLEDLLYKADKRIEELKRTARDELDVEVEDKLQRLEITKSNLRNVNSSYSKIKEELKSLKKDYKKIKEENNVLEEKNKVLRNKYNRFEIMDI
jgi:chromosome segregation ATPase